MNYSFFLENLEVSGATRVSVSHAKEEKIRLYFAVSVTVRIHSGPYSPASSDMGRCLDLFLKVALSILLYPSVTV
jgi:hypothetical protein